MTQVGGDPYKSSILDKMITGGDVDQNEFTRAGVNIGAPATLSYDPNADFETLMEDFFPGSSQQESPIDKAQQKLAEIKDRLNGIGQKCTPGALDNCLELIMQCPDKEVKKSLIKEHGALQRLFIEKKENIDQGKKTLDDLLDRTDKVGVVKMLSRSGRSSSLGSAITRFGSDLAALILPKPTTKAY